MHAKEKIKDAEEPDKDVAEEEEEEEASLGVHAALKQLTICAPQSNLFIF